jgi:hypothetical protein
MNNSIFDNFSNAEAPVSHQVLLKNIKSNLELFQNIDEFVSDEWVSVDLIYRFWHQSFKVYGLQEATLKMYEALKMVSPNNDQLNPWFEDIIKNGTGKVFELSFNKDWVTHTKPIVDAFLHAKFFLEQVLKSACSLDEAPTLLPSYWAAVLELYQIR